VSEKFECFSLVIGVSGLTSLDLSQQSDGFVTILVAIAGENSVQMCLCSLKVAHVEWHLGEAEECLIVARIVAKTFFILLESRVVVFLDVLNLAEDEMECW